MTDGNVSVIKGVVYPEIGYFLESNSGSLLVAYKPPLIHWYIFGDKLPKNHEYSLVKRENVGR